MWTRWGERGARPFQGGGLDSETEDWEPVGTVVDSLGAGVDSIGGGVGSIGEEVVVVSSQRRDVVVRERVGTDDLSWRVHRKHCANGLTLRSRGIGDR